MAYTTLMIVLAIITNTEQYSGAAIDLEEDGPPIANAAGNDAFDVDNEDGVFSVDPFFVPGSIVNIDILLSDDTVVNAWIGVNCVCDWADAGEQVVVDQSISGGSNVLTVKLPPNVVNG